MPVFFTYFFYRLNQIFLLTFLILTPFFLQAKKPEIILNKNDQRQKDEIKIVESTGLAQITKSGEQSAYERALEHAMRNAVEETLGTMIESQTLVKNATLIEDHIYSKSTGFIQKYKVLNTKKSGKTKIVTIQAWVTIKDIKDDVLSLGILQQRVTRPYLMVLVKDASSQLKNSPYEAHVKEIFQNYLTEKQFQFIDETTYKSILNIQKKKSNLEALAQIISKNGVQILIQIQIQYAKQNVSFLPDNWTSIRSTLEANAIYAGDASLIASASHQGAYSSIDPITATKGALKKTSKKAVESLFKTIIKRWDDMINQGFEYQLIISKISYGEATSIKDNILKNIEGIKNIFERGFNKKTLTLLVRYSGNSSELVKMLINENKVLTTLKLTKYNTKSISLVKK